jgi:alanyl-tRNA synthetase
MEKMGLNEIRKNFLEFFESKEHYARMSYSLVPKNDKSLLLVNAGMAPLKTYFMGTEAPPNKRMATCQKCIRTGDIENVGITARHATFFEMLGNFSFGDYFKRESIAWGWEFVTGWLDMPVDKLWVTVYEDDDEAYEIWEKEIGIPRERIVRLGKDDNFWEIGTGPCGPCSEIYFDRGEKFSCGLDTCKPGCDCDRFIEFWNHVFTQYDKDNEGNYNLLPKPNIDTGMGLERVACIMQNVETIFEIDTIKYVLDGVIELTGKQYGKNRKDDISIRIITDHIRAVTFMTADGIIPSNEGRGYVLRRLLRRAARHGKLMGIEKQFLTELVDRVIEISKDAYPELFEKREYIKKVLEIEEKRFQKTIDSGIEILNGHIEFMKKDNNEMLSGKDAFILYDTYGFPLDLTREILEEIGCSVDEAEFEKEMTIQKDRARQARKDQNDVGWEFGADLDKLKTERTEFVGYEIFEAEGEVLAIIKEGIPLEEAKKGEEVQIIMDVTPFYAESGGQVADKGLIKTSNGLFKVSDCKKKNNLYIHYGIVLEGLLSVGEAASSKIDKKNRMDTARNHTATHLLHRALKNILGEHVEQAGSLVTPNRLRFDFTHFDNVNKEELDGVEAMVNEKIFEALHIDISEMDLDKAKELGATALFGEKYGKIVRVVKVDDYSTELCGGTHLKNTSEVGLFKIYSEGGIAAGVRRIEAVTGRKAYAYVKQAEKEMNNIMALVKANNEKEIEGKIVQILDELKTSKKACEEFKKGMASSSMDELLSGLKKINGFDVVTGKLDDLDAETLRGLGDKILNKLENGVVVLVSDDGEKLNYAAIADKEAIAKGIHCGKLIKDVAKIASGGGGGRANMAQAGAKDRSKALLSLEQVYKHVESI